MTDIEVKVIESYVKTLGTVKKILAGKVGAFEGELNWPAHSEGIHALIEVNQFIDSAINHLELKSGIKEDMTMPDGSPMPRALKEAIERANDADDGTLTNGNYL